jgi:hypothetical protein
MARTRKQERLFQPKTGRPQSKDRYKKMILNPDDEGGEAEYEDIWTEENEDDFDEDDAREEDQ